MALPKGKISKSRGRMRRANWKLSAPGIVKHCGYYDGKQVINMEAETASEK